MSVSTCIAQYFLAVVAASYIIFVICSSGIFASTRQWIRARALSESMAVKIPFHHLKRLVGCPFCTGFWVSAGIVVVYNLNVFPGTENTILWKALSVCAISMPAAMIAFVGSLMVGQVHKALAAMQALEDEKLAERKRLAEQGLEVPTLDKIAARN